MYASLKRIKKDRNQLKNQIVQENQNLITENLKQHPKTRLKQAKTKN